MVFQVLAHPISKFLSGTCFEKIDQVEMSNLSPCWFFFQCHQVPKDGKQHSLETLHGIIAGHPVDLTMKFHFTLDAKSNVILIPNFFSQCYLLELS